MSRTSLRTYSFLLALLCAVVVAEASPGLLANGDKSAKDGKPSYVKCADDDECRLVRSDLVCRASKCRRDCPGACEAVTLCKSDRNCWNLGPYYSCAEDGVCARRPEEELQEGSKCTVEAHCFPESTMLHCDRQTGRCLCNKPKVWNNLDKTCSDPSILLAGQSDYVVPHHSTARRLQGLKDDDSGGDESYGSWETFDRWEPLVAIGLFIFILAVIALILKFWISRASDADRIETKAAKMLRTRLEIVKHHVSSASSPRIATGRPEQILAAVRAGPTGVAAATPTTMPDEPASRNKVKALLISLRLPPFNKLKEEAAEDEEQVPSPC